MGAEVSQPIFLDLSATARTAAAVTKLNANPTADLSSPLGGETVREGCAESLREVVGRTRSGTALKPNIEPSPPVANPAGMAGSNTGYAAAASAAATVDPRRLEDQ